MDSQPEADPPSTANDAAAQATRIARREAAISAARIGTWWWRPQERRLEMDSECLRALGLPASSFDGSLESYIDIVHPQDRPLLLATIARLPNELAPLALEYRTLTPGGRIRHVHGTAQQIPDTDDGPGEVVGTCRDVTFEVEVRATLEERQQALERANQELDDFTYIASHDLKEPLRGIHTYAGFLLEDYAAKLGDDGRKMLESLAGQAERMQRLIDDLLQIARLGREPLRRQPVALDALVDDVLKTLAFTLEERGVEIIRPAPLPTLSADPIRLAEVYRNLIGNAIKYNTATPPRITLTAEGEGLATRLGVADNGIGIDAAHHERIFFPFKRLHAREAHGGGSGVGLTIVRKIVEAHGGRVTLQSAPGTGSCFTFTLNPEPPT